MAPNNTSTETNESQKKPSVVPSWVTEECFRDIVAKEFPDYTKITKFEAEPGSAAGDNYASVIIRILIELELKDGSSRKLSLMMKINHSADSSTGQLMSELGIFDKEITVYNVLIPAFEKLYADKGKIVSFGPKSYELSKDVKTETVVLEDLRQKSFKNADRLKGLDMDHTESVLKRLAEFHAASVVYREEHGKYHAKFYKFFFDSSQLAELKPLYDSNVPLVKSCISDCMKNGKYFSERVYGNSEDAIVADLKLFSTKEDSFNVLNHGDCWVNNFMFSYDDKGNRTDTKLIDYQMCKYGSPAQDLYYFLISSVQLDLKLTKFDHFIKYYHNHLKANLKLLGYTKPIPTLKDLHIELLQGMRWAMFSACGVMSIVLLKPTENASLDNFLSDSEDAVEWRRSIYTGDLYVKAMNDVLPWLDNRGAFEQI